MLQPIRSTVLRALSLVTLVAALFAMSACPPPSAQVARSRVTAFASLVSDGVDIESDACAAYVAQSDTATATRDQLAKALSIAHACQAVRDRTRRALLALLDAERTWTDASAGKVGCIAVDVLAATKDFAALAKAIGFAVPSRLTDLANEAAALAPLALPACVPSPTSSSTTSSAATVSAAVVTSPASPAVSATPTSPKP